MAGRGPLLRPDSGALARDNTFYPTRGSLSDLTADFINDSWGGDFTYEVYDVDYRAYRPLGDTGVLAWHIA